MDEAIGAEFEALRQRIAGLEGQLTALRASVENAHRDEMIMLRRLVYGTSSYLGDHTAMTTLVNGYRCLVDTRDRAVGMHLMHGGNWEGEYTEAFRRMLAPGAVVLDVGANLGWYSLIAAPIVGPTGRVIALEPNPRLAQLLVESVHNNGFYWTRVVQSAVSDKVGLVDLYSHHQSPGGGRILPADLTARLVPARAHRVAAIPLDMLLAEEPPIDVMKIDIEGWEGMALRGMTATLDRSPRMRILMEWSEAQEDTPAPRSAIQAMLGARGYTPFRVALDGSLRRSSWEDVDGEPSIINLVMLPGGDPLEAAAKA